MWNRLPNEAKKNWNNEVKDQEKNANKLNFVLKLKVENK
jgi:hypothetical protein